MILRRVPTAAVSGLCAPRSCARHASSRATRSAKPVSGRAATTATRSSGWPPTPNDARPTEDKAARVAKLRAVPLTLAAITAFGIGLYGVQLWVSTTRAVDSSIAGPQTQEELTSVYDQTAATFDAEVDVSEWLMGIKGARKRLAEGCSGHVLEVSCGTARNLGYYRFGEGIKSLTLADLSLEMVQQGKQKWFALRDKGQLAGTHKGIPVRFWRGDVKTAMPPPPTEEQTGITPAGYDTIVQSMGLCSTDEPVELLRNLVQHLNPDNPEARIVLLEHGRSYYPWWNRVLDSQAATHATKHGCWWNRDIGDIVRRSGLMVVHERRRNFGTTWIFELKPVRPQAAGTGDEGGAAKETIDGSEGWSEWLPRWTYEKICKR